MNLTEATTHLNELIADADDVQRNSSRFDAWNHKCQVVIERIFGKNSDQWTSLSGIKYRFNGLCKPGDKTPHILALANGVDKAKEVIRTCIWELERFGLPTGSGAVPAPVSELEIIENICDRFHPVARQLRQRHDNRATLDVSDEYDVQDLLHGLLTLHFKDIRPEDWTPSYAGSGSRVDFLLKSEGIVIECKKTRKGLDAKKIGEQLIIDIARYKAHPNCRILFCFIYDPESWLKNPAGIENDLSSVAEDFTVKVVISPH